MRDTSKPLAPCDSVHRGFLGAMEKIYNINELQRMQEALSNALEITAILSYKQAYENPDFNWQDLWDANQLLLELIKEEESK